MLALDDNAAKAAHAKIQRVASAYKEFLLRAMYPGVDLKDMRQFLELPYVGLTYHMSLWERAAAYRVANKVCLELPHDFISLWNRDRKGFEAAKKFQGNLIASRLIWLQKRERDGLELYPAEGRYGGLNIRQADVARDLDPRLRHLLEPTNYYTSPLEWDQFLTLVAYITLHAEVRMRTYMDGLLKGIVKELKALNGNVPANSPETDIYTTECTAEAMVSDPPHCSICYCDFGYNMSGNGETEPAVKTTCGHILGKACMERLVTREGYDNCPMCRQALFSIEHRLPENYQEMYKVFSVVYEDLKRTDRYVDQYLLEGEEGTYDEDFVKFLHGLVRLCHAMITSTDFFRQEAQRLEHLPR
jgi:hypothetical protein